MTLWLIPQNGNPTRLRVIDRSFAPCFYVRGAESRLRRLGRMLAARARVTWALTEREDIWEGERILVLQVAVHHPTQFSALVRFVHRNAPGLRLYNSDLMLAPLYCWEKNVFPLAKVEVEVERFVAALYERRLVNSKESAVTDRRYSILAMESRDDEWKIDYELPPLRVMQVRLEGLAQVDPKHGRRGAVEVAVDGDWRVLDDADEPVAVGFERLLRAHDPDLIVSEWGDSTLFPGLLRQARKCGVELPLNRDPACGGAVERSRARSYMSYGRILFKESATTLRGRLHVDTQNSFIADQCDLDGLWELARVTKLPVQYTSRTSTGTGISYMQMELAYRDGVLIPAQKAEPESPKHPDELLAADRGGLVFPPRLGFFTNVGELDFISEFPSIMARFNVSPETVNCRCCPQAPRVPELGYRICQRRRGITSRVVERLIRKRQEYKRRMKTPGLGIEGSGFAVAAVCDRRNGEVEGHGFSRAVVTPPHLVHRLTDTPLPLEGERAGGGGGLRTIPPPEKGPRLEERQPWLPEPGDSNSCPNPEPRIPNPANYGLRRSALKWLLVCCFGYTGYKNARFGKIEAHEAINALAREKLLVAMETAERAGFRVLHALVDSLYVQRQGAGRDDYARLTREIEQHTGLPMALEAVYRYVVFLPSKQSPEVPVPNRFFCVPEEGEPKIRGLECRRHDTPPIVARMQREALAILAEAHDFESYCRKLEEAREVLERYLARVENGSVNVEELVISRRLTRAPDAYRQNSATAIAAKQLDRSGVQLRPGETIEYIITDADSNLVDDRVRAFTLWEGWRGYDVGEYQRALREAFKPLEHYVLRNPPAGRPTISVSAMLTITSIDHQRA
jgi:DNA polymerase elongation subunit (family B)